MSIRHLLESPLRAQGLEELEGFWKRLQERPLWNLKCDDGAAFVFERVRGTAGLLWMTTPIKAASLAEAKRVLVKPDDGFRLPTFDELKRFASNPRNPLRDGKPYRLKDLYAVFTNEELTDLDDGYWRRGADGEGHLFAVSDYDLSAGPALDFLFRTVRHCTPANDQTGADIWSPVLARLQPAALLADIDWRPVRLPRLDALELTDRNKGLWEWHGADAGTLEALGIRSRDPALDIRDHHVAIDFGTSSTVVAYEEDGSRKLLRVGVQDYLRAPQAFHYENPTVLEFVDLEAALEPWTSRAYRPLLEWDHVRSSHEALNSLRANETDPSVVSSILPKIKQWALRESADARTRVTDRQGVEHVLAPLGLRAPVRGAALEVGKDDDFDPVELYAWHLGMIINWRKRGIHLRYYMTFPVAYPRDVKDRILASFKRGLQRSLPAAIVDSAGFSDFVVEERASEPAAYAACALRTLGIEATGVGAAYAVFDFGGGTADFDFGFYRLPDAAEQDDGYEAVFEHFGSAGDRFLGGENLLENMAYHVFRENLAQCRERQISFSKPLDADDFPGSELFLDRTQAALTNTLMLIAKLRPLWETGSYDNSSGIEKLTLLNRQGEKTTCELSIPVDALQAYLVNRIGQGVLSFCTALHRAFGEAAPESINVLLAGNASRSAVVQGYFGLGDDAGSEGMAGQLHALTKEWMETLFGSRTPVLLAHAPMPQNEEKPFSPTGKTGVALGLLDLCPGGVFKVVNRSAPHAGSEAPFAHFVGRIQQGRFTPGLCQGAAYGRWAELGPQREKVFHLRHTTSAFAHTGKMAADHPGLHSRRLDFSGEIAGHRVYARALGPDMLEICTAASLALAEEGQLANARVISL